MGNSNGYKAFDKDLRCRGFQFEIGQVYGHDGDIKLCESGFHYCKSAADVFQYYSFASETRVCEVEDLGAGQGDNTKIVTNKIKIVREISRQELLTLINSGRDNTGLSNSGAQNSGAQNSGNRNSGHWNSGDQNSGNRNSGHWNSGAQNSGLFNTTEPGLRLFNRLTKIKMSDPRIQAVLQYSIAITEWVWFLHMTDQEKQQHPAAAVTDGYLKSVSYKEAWLNFWVNASGDARNAFKLLPFFDATIFQEITGIDVNKTYNK